MEMTKLADRWQGGRIVWVCQWRVKRKMYRKNEFWQLYDTFLKSKEENLDEKIGFSKFAEARPKHVVLPGASRTDNVCVCVYHKNPKLIIDHSQIKSKPEFKQLIGSEES